MYSERYSIAFYQALGKLFYAIASADKHVHLKEYNKLKDIVKNEWLPVDDYEDDFNTDAAYQIEIVFDWLNKHEELHPYQWFNEFLDFKKEHEKLFTDHIKHLILKTANAIAYSFSGKNKSELIMLTKLNLELKKTLNEK
jgi:hypothetical protein